MRAEQRQLERAERRPGSPDVERRRCRRDRFEIVRLPVGAVRSPNVSTRQRARFCERQRIGVVGAEEQQAAARHEVDETPERQRIGVEIGVDVGVIELDVVDDGDVRQVLQELRGLVEERAVVFVAFDDEVAAAADAIARPSAEVFARCRR